MKLDMVMNQFKVNVLRLLLNEICQIKEITTVFLTASYNFNVGMHSDSYELIWFKLGVMVVTAECYILILVCDLDLDS